MVAALVLAVAGCRTSPAPAPVPGSPGATAGAASPRAAAERFMQTIRDQDIQATSNIWGSERGPARTILTDRVELEKRIIVLQCNLQHDRFRILSDLPGDKPNARSLRVEVTKGQLTANTTMAAVQATDGRWYINDPDIRPLRGFCAETPASAPARKPKR
ncbi:MAG: hypothetical protein MUF21_05025 [Gemmatimonadaceae bacterium]|nr:hypothetical protein [Gemmatimonadaceae bacterium]